MTDTPRLTRGVVTLHTSAGPRHVPGLILGALAVTPDHGGDAFWVITHVETGRRIHPRGSYGYFIRRVSAVAAMRDLIAAVPDWSLEALRGWVSKSGSTWDRIAEIFHRRNGDDPFSQAIEGPF